MQTGIDGGFVYNHAGRRLTYEQLKDAGWQLQDGDYVVLGPGFSYYAPTFDFDAGRPSGFQFSDQPACPDMAWHFQEVQRLIELDRDARQAGVPVAYMGIGVLLGIAATIAVLALWGRR